jgi:hypothetical protein
MAHERKKIDEATYFYSQMLQELNNRETFNFNLSAFLSAARSVLQYGLKEAKTKKGGQRWCETRIAGSRVLSFFKDKRDFNIHSEPLTPIQHVEETIKSTIHFTGSVSIIHRDAKGNILYQSPPEPPESKAKQIKTEPPTTAKTRYFFSDWNGNQDVMTLSEMYLNELQHVVEDGIKNGFLTGQQFQRSERK